MNFWNQLKRKLSKGKGSVVEKYHMKECGTYWCVLLNAMNKDIMKIPSAYEVAEQL